MGFFNFYVLHYEELLKEEAIASLAASDCLCLDEIHFVKQRAGQESSQRRVALETLRDSARAAIGLTREFCGNTAIPANSLGNTAD